jgi:hypothetical protein
MWSMWTAPSDLDYYASFGGEPDDEEFERCSECGARWDAGQECEPWCANQPASEPAPTAFFEIQPTEAGGAVNRNVTTKKSPCPA